MKLNDWVILKEELIMKKRKCTLYAWVFVILGACVLNGCTKEKAEAIKVTAEQFRIEAMAAINQLKNIVKQSIEMPAQKNKLMMTLSRRILLTMIRSSCF